MFHLPRVSIMKHLSSFIIVLLVLLMCSEMVYADFIALDASTRELLTNDAPQQVGGSKADSIALYACLFLPY